eukprot:scaffold111638_cov33-Tisochrysis_lutea.AAC.1
MSASFYTLRRLRNELLNLQERVPYNQLPLRRITRARRSRQQAISASSWRHAAAHATGCATIELEPSGARSWNRARFSFEIASNAWANGFSQPNVGA